MDKINLSWWTGTGGKNWGDALNPILAKLISNKEIVSIPLKDDSNIFRYYMIGSILHSVNSNNSIVWGSGFISINDKIPKKPKEIHAVRGKLTRNLLLKQGCSCPEIYGDPALLYPKYYFPKINKKYKLGIIPHYIDANNIWLNQFKNNNEILIINILEGINKVVDDILSCDCIISSSLHGIIAADSYNIPSLWVEFSDKVIGNGFKFRDYFSSVNRIDTTPIKIDTTTKLADIMNQFYDYKIDIDLEKLYNSCPFKK
jgi:pyruvyltransferase